jgi:hypothetical protein
VSTRPLTHGRRRAGERAAAADHGRPRVGAADDKNSDPTASSTPHIVHPDLATPVALGASHEQRSATRVQVRFAERERFIDSSLVGDTLSVPPTRPSFIAVQGGSECRVDLRFCFGLEAAVTLTALAAARIRGTLES